jgi:hypothetical protein
MYRDWLKLRSSEMWRNVVWWMFSIDSEKSTVCVRSVHNIGTHCDLKGVFGADKDKWGVLTNTMMKTSGSVNGGEVGGNSRISNWEITDLDITPTWGGRVWRGAGLLTAREATGLLLVVATDGSNTKLHRDLKTWRISGAVSWASALRKCFQNG